MTLEVLSPTELKLYVSNLDIAQGAQGPAGPMGQVGPQGVAGPQGAASTVAGPAGPAGPMGQQGVPGIKGDTGEKGDQGNSGPQGAQGEIGLTGPQGPQGLQGIQGLQGAVGPQGLQGIQGETGAQGQAGASVTLKGSVANTAALPSTNNTIGDSYINDEDGNLYVWTGSTWHDAGQIVGPQGPQGIQGIQGVQGEAGTYPNYVGEYSNGQSYAVNDIVSTGVGSPYGNPGQLFIRVSNPGNPGYPPGTASWQEYYAGATGPQGLQGIAGNTPKLEYTFNQTIPNSSITGSGASITFPHDNLYARFLNANVKILGIQGGLVRHTIFGVISSFNSTTTTVSIGTAALGTGFDNISEWQIATVGQRGQAGAQGATGAQGQGVQYNFSIAPFAYTGDNVNTSIFVNTGLSYMGGETIFFQGGNQNGYRNMTFAVNGYIPNTGEMFVQGLSSFTQGDLSGIQNLNANLIGRPGAQGPQGQTGASFIVSPNQPSNVAYGTVWIQA